MMLDSIDDYDFIIVAFSGGKDSLACLLYLLEEGVNPEKIELWHHLVDGAPGTQPFMDWPITESYCKAVSKHLGIPMYFSWRAGGFKQEMLRQNEATGQVYFEHPNGPVTRVRGVSKPLTRRKFPMPASIVNGRWCSAKLKIDVCRSAINNQSRFEFAKTLLITGERAEESKNRASYQISEKHASDGSHMAKKRRVVHGYRPVLKWSEEEVWDIIRTHEIRPHPAYYCGFGRVSCAPCIFGGKDQWATLITLVPQQIEEVVQYEKEFGHTIHSQYSVPEQIARGNPYPSIDPTSAKLVGETKYTLPIHMDPWVLPSGAFKKTGGPT